jgi:hypothetical protein
MDEIEANCLGDIHKPGRLGRFLRRRSRRSRAAAEGKDAEHEDQTQAPASARLSARMMHDRDPDY